MLDWLLFLLVLFSSGLLVRVMCWCWMVEWKMLIGVVFCNVLDNCLMYIRILLLWLCISMKCICGVLRVVCSSFCSMGVLLVIMLYLVVGVNWLVINWLVWVSFWCRFCKWE